MHYNQFCPYFQAAIMWIQVRTMDGKKSSQIDELSKLTKIEELRSKLEKAFDVPANMQRLFFRGKQVNYTMCTSGSFRKQYVCISVMRVSLLTQQPCKYNVDLIYKHCFSEFVQWWYSFQCSCSLSIENLFSLHGKLGIAVSIKACCLTCIYR